MKAMTLKIACLTFALCASSAGCRGYMQQNNGEAPTTTAEEEPAQPSGGPDATDQSELCDVLDTGAGPMHRLTQKEYNNTVQDLFADVDLPRQTFPSEEKVDRYNANVSLPVDPRLVEAYRRSAEQISKTVIEDPAAYTGCPDKKRECVHAFIEDLVTRAYRRPVSDEELDRLTDLYDWSKQNYTTKTSVRLVIQAILQSPNFLYRVEIGEPIEGGLVALTDYEIASRLSYLLWDSAPDEELLALAADARLSTPDQIEQQARRMLTDRRARRVLNQFAMQWMGLDHIDNLEVPDEQFDDSVRESMQAETVAFIDHVMWESSGSIDELLTADYTFIDQNLAEIYGLDAPADNSMMRVELSGTNRRGVLTHPSILATHAEGAPAVYRGQFVQAALLCSPLPPPPDQFVDPPETYQGQSTRERATDRMEHSQCGVCHKPMEGIGLAFDQFDVMGRWQTEDEHGNSLTDDGRIYGLPGTDGELDGVADLAGRLAQSEQVRECVTKQMFRYSFGRYMSSKDACSQQMLEAALDKSDGDLRELLVAITRTDAFRYRHQTEQ